jgi:LysR family glycine cleavage system transcriptional activator
MPKVRPHVIYAAQDTDISDSDADVIISGFSHNYHGAGFAVRLLDGKVRPACSPQYLAKIGPIRSPEDLLRADFLHDGSRDGWVHWLSKAGITHRADLGGVIFQDYGLLSTAAVTGQGVALCPTAFIRDQQQRRELVELFDIDVYEERAYWVVRSKEASKIIQSFTAWVCDTTKAFLQTCAVTHFYRKIEDESAQLRV